MFFSFGSLFIKILFLSVSYSYFIIPIFFNLILSLRYLIPIFYPFLVLINRLILQRNYFKIIGIFSFFTIFIIYFLQLVPLKYYLKFLQISDSLEKMCYYKFEYLSPPPLVQTLHSMYSVRNIDLTPFDTMNYYYIISFFKAIIYNILLFTKELGVFIPLLLRWLIIYFINFSFFFINCFVEVYSKFYTFLSLRFNPCIYVFSSIFKTINFSIMFILNPLCIIYTFVFEIGTYIVTNLYLLFFTLITFRFFILSSFTRFFNIGINGFSFIVNYFLNSIFNFSSMYFRILISYNSIIIYTLLILSVFSILSHYLIPNNFNIMLNTHLNNFIFSTLFRVRNFFRNNRIHIHPSIGVIVDYLYNILQDLYNILQDFYNIRLYIYNNLLNFNRNILINVLRMYIHLLYGLLNIPRNLIRNLF